MLERAQRLHKYRLEVGHAIPPASHADTLAYLAGSIACVSLTIPIDGNAYRHVGFTVAILAALLNVDFEPMNAFLDLLSR